MSHRNTVYTVIVIITCNCRFDMMRVMSFNQSVLSDIGERTAVQRLERSWVTRCPIGLVIPWKYHIEHAKESPFTYEANIADRDIVIGTFGRLWIPQGKPVAQGCEFFAI